MKRWILLGLGLLALSTVVMTAEAQAECKVVASTPTYTEGQLKDIPCDESGNVFTTLGTLLNTEVPATTYRYISVGASEDKHAVKATPAAQIPFDTSVSLQNLLNKWIINLTPVSQPYSRSDGFAKQVRFAPLCV